MTDHAAALSRVARVLSGEPRCIVYDVLEEAWRAEARYVADLEAIARDVIGVVDDGGEQEMVS